jgi:hypothetical protein
MRIRECATSELIQENTMISTLNIRERIYTKVASKPASPPFDEALDKAFETFALEHPRWVLPTRNH